MNKLTYLFVGLVLVGTGCTTVTQEEQDDTSVTEDPVVEEVEETEDDSIDEEPMSYEFPGTLSSDRIENKQVHITTEKGDIVFTLFADTAPNTVSNFVYLAEQGYFDELTFHRRVEDFVIQGGDPDGIGTGGPGYKFADELDDEYEYVRGIVAMANSGPDTNGSQFFIMLADTPLPKAYSIFGEVTLGMDVVDKIVVGDVMTTVKIEDKE